LAAVQRKSVIVNEQEEKIFKELVELLEKLSIKVKYDRGHFNGGLVRYKNQFYLYLNRAAKTKTKIDLILNELQYLKIPEQYLSGELSQFLQRSLPNRSF